MAYATYEDVVLRYPHVADQCTDRVNALIADATAVIDWELAECGVSIDQNDATQAQNLLAVTCSMVARAVSDGNSVYGVSSLTQMAGPIQQTVSYSNPNDDMYLTAGERRKLGILHAAGKQLFYGADLLGGE